MVEAAHAEAAASWCLELEALRQLKARYFRHLDTKQWQAYGEVFTEDALMDVRADVGGGEAGLVSGRDAIVAGVSASLAKARTVHHGHMAELERLAEGRARGIWAMEDYVEWDSPGARGVPRIRPLPRDLPQGRRGVAHREPATDPAPARSPGSLTAAASFQAPPMEPSRARKDCRRADDRVVMRGDGEPRLLRRGFGAYASARMRRRMP